MANLGDWRIIARNGSKEVAWRLNMAWALSEGAMNKSWILFHLRETREELAQLITRIEAAPDVDEIELEIAFAHMYNHLNTAWNARAITDAQIAASSAGV